MLGGALGNLVDRIFRAPGPLQGHVVDIVSLFAPDGSVWPVFNLADSAIVCGGVLLSCSPCSAASSTAPAPPTARPPTVA